MNAVSIKGVSKPIELTGKIAEAPVTDPAVRRARLGEPLRPRARVRQ